MWKKLLTLYLIFGLSLAVLIALSLYAYQRFNAYVGYAEGVDRNHTVIGLLNSFRLQFTEIENHQRGYILFNDTTYYEQYTNYISKLRSTFGVVYELMKEDEAQLKRMKALNLAMRKVIDDLQSGIYAGYPPVDYRVGKRYMERCQNLIDEMEAEEKNRLAEKQSTRHFYEENTPKNFRLLFVFTLAVFIISFIMLVQQYRDRMKYQRKLEENILELNQANSEWEQIAYIASHDLQEPLRKIRTFSDLLRSRNMDQLDEEGKSLVERIDVASSRAQSLMHDIVTYNMIVYTREDLERISLAEALSEVVEEMREQLLEKNAVVDYENLPEVKGYVTQIHLLFKCLIENSLKFAKEGHPVKITITASEVSHRNIPVDQSLPYSQYHRVIFEDNGIGFDNRFSEKIFKIFQRLHSQDSNYKGRGIGLAMVKRIMTNHVGYIIARGRPGSGARFTLYFPVR